MLNETTAERREDGGKYHIARSEAAFSEQLVRAWAAMAATGDPNAAVGDGGAVGWPTFAASPRGSALLIGGGAGQPGNFSAAHDLIHAKCELFDEVLEAGRGPRRVVHLFG